MGGAKGFQMLNPQVAPGSTNPDPGASGAAGSINVGGYTPDWKSLIEGDAGLIDAKSALAAGGVQDLAQRNAAIQRALVQFGKVPDLGSLAKSLGMSQADIQDAAGPDVQKLAQENTDAGLSTEARLAQANQDAVRQITNSLNARGILNSGETGFQLDRQNTANRQGEYDANQKLLDYLQQYQQGYVSAQQAKEQSLAQAYSDAANRQYNLNQGSAGQQAAFDHVDSAGHAVYRGPSGSLFNADGSPYTAPAPAAPQAPAVHLPTTYSNPGDGRPVRGPSIFAFK